MVLKKKILLLFSLCLTLTTIKAASLRQKRQTDTNNEESEIKKFHVNSKIQLRYAITKEVAQNIYNESTDTSGLLQTTSQPEFTDGKQVNIHIMFRDNCKSCFEKRDFYKRPISVFLNFISWVKLKEGD